MPKLMSNAYFVQHLAIAVKRFNIRKTALMFVIRYSTVLSDAVAIRIKCHHKPFCNASSPLKSLPRTDHPDLWSEGG